MIIFYYTCTYLQENMDVLLFIGKCIRIQLGYILIWTYYLFFFLFLRTLSLTQPHKIQWTPDFMIPSDHWIPERQKWHIASAWICINFGCPPSWGLRSSKDFIILKVFYFHDNRGCLCSTTTAASADEITVQFISCSVLRLSRGGEKECCFGGLHACAER